MITKEQKERALNNMKVARYVDQQINLPQLPKGWSIVYPHMGFCKVCHTSIVSMMAILSPGGRSYYHFKCLLKSKLLIKQLAGKI